MTSDPAKRSLRIETRESGPARSFGDGWRRRHDRFVKEEGNPFLSGRMVARRTATKFVPAGVVPDQLRVAE